ncbi:MAG: hypothetical protein HUK40_20480 [Desulfobacter sp.]|nr:hypothetical protein [Desulfobacter sp.]
METKVQAAPANVMFVLDNSGSMDWEFMPPQSDGKFEGEFYLYPDSAFINSYQDRAYNSDYILNSTERRMWKGQWAGYNKLFFDANAIYSPWPKMNDADTSTPWSNPYNTNSSSSKFNMEGEYYALTAGSGGTVSVKNAHYFVIDDTDSDGVQDTGEDVYLVNFVAGVRAYYLFTDHDNDNTMDNGELYLKTGAAIPNGVKASRYDEDDTFLSYVTDAQDLQNFANWFSFYRKRELTAKAAVAGAIYNLDWVYVGFYSINGSVAKNY